MKSAEHELATYSSPPLWMWDLGFRDQGLGKRVSGARTDSKRNPPPKGFFSSSEKVFLVYGAGDRF